MGVSTFGIGILPNYSRLGVWAPLSLVFFRFVKGFTLGGEWGGAVLMSVEDAPQSKRGLFGSFVALGLPAGIILSNVVFLIASTIVTPEQFADVGLAHTIPCERSISGNRVVRPCKDRGKSRICQGIYIGPQAAAFAELFPPAVRYSGASLSITIGTVIGGAIAPFVATALYSTTGNSWPVTVYAVALSIISWLCALALTEGPSTTATPNVMLN